MALNLQKDDVDGQIYASFLIRPCPHPAVVRKYGTGGRCNTSVHTCVKCQYMARNKDGHVICGYEEKTKGNMRNETQQTGSDL